MGGVNYKAIDTIFDTFKVFGQQRETYFDKCLICIKAITQNREREHAKHKTKPNRKR